jgi:hypothetical protein
VVAGKTAEAHDAEVVIERPDGSRVTVIVNIRPLKNDRGEVTGAINAWVAGSGWSPYLGKAVDFGLKCLRLDDALRPSGLRRAVMARMTRLVGAAGH